MHAKLDLSAFVKALATFKRSIDVSSVYIEDEHAATDLKETLRAGVIQHFECCYELSWKMLKRQLEHDASNYQSIDALSYPELIREGAERGLIADAKKWLIYRHQRNITSHTYHEDKAVSVYHTALEFYSDAKQLLDILIARHQ